MPKYEQRDVYIVVDHNHFIHQVFGIEQEAINYAEKNDNLTVDTWPAEFEKEESHGN